MAEVNDAANKEMTPEETPLRSIMSMQTHKCALPRPRSGQFGNDLQVFLRRPCAGGASAHIAQRAERQRKFSDIITVWRSRGKLFHGEFSPLVLSWAAVRAGYRLSILSRGQAQELHFELSAAAPNSA
jgi:hypothetical protein